MGTQSEKVNSRFEWEKVYEQGLQNNSFPWSDLVSLYHRYKSELLTNRTSIKVVEFGSGTCNNYPLFKNIGADYWGIESSETAINESLRKFPELDGKLIKCSFHETPLEITDFDYVIDRGSITCNSSAYISDLVSEIYSRLIPGGLFIGVDWFSDKHSEYSKGQDYFGDPLTKHDFPSGYFQNLGITHFTNEVDLRNSLNIFELLHLSEKIVDVVESNFTGKNRFASWSFVARKPNDF
jgi:SAM-dependent methyltransferase